LIKKRRNLSSKTKVKRREKKKSWRGIIFTQAQPTLETAFAIGMSRYELGRYEYAITAFSVIQNDNFASGKQKVLTIANARTWSEDKKMDWLNELSPKVEARDTRAIAANLKLLESRIKMEQKVLKEFKPTQDERKMKRKLQYITDEISWERKGARKNWFSERKRELEAEDIDAICVAVSALESNYSNAQNLIQQGMRYFYHAIATSVWIGTCYLKLGKLRDAERIWAEAKEQYAENPDFWSELGLAYSLNKGNSTRQIAVSLLPDTIAKNTDEKDLASTFCENALNLLEYEVDDIGNCVVKHADYKYFRNLGRALKRNGESSIALEAFKKGQYNLAIAKSDAINLSQYQDGKQIDAVLNGAILLATGVQKSNLFGPSWMPSSRQVVYSNTMKKADILLKWLSLIFRQVNEQLAYQSRFD